MTLASNSSPATVLDLIGKTPLVKVTHIDTGKCDLFLKLECQNPSGSIKDRIALSMVEAAEKEGKLRKGMTLVEATAGNTGLALALVAAQKGYKLTLIIPDKMSQEKIFHLKALGVNVVLTRSDVEKGHPDYYQDKARQFAEDNADAYFINQFENAANPLAHEKTTAPEIWEQMQGDVDAIVCGVGSSGTLTGLARYFRQVAPDVEMVLADPQGSILAPLVNQGLTVKAGSWLVEGIGEDYIPTNFQKEFVKKAYTITDFESIATSRLVLEKEGVLCGSSSGTLIAAALRYCREQTEPKRVVTFACDSGNKYLSKIFNPYWLDDNGMIERPETHDLRDLIARPFLRGEVVWAAPHNSLQSVYAKMRSFDVSQIPVMDKGHLLGLLDEADILLTVAGNEAGFSIAAAKVMRENPVTIQVKAPVTELSALFERCRAVCVMDKEQFLGLITPIDFLNYLRKRTGKA